MNNQNYIEGYKAFDSNFTALNNTKFKPHEHKHIDGIIKAGPINGHGFHLCTNFEDTFRFVGDNPILCEVIGFGTISTEYLDEYNGYYGIYACSDIYIKRIITREEIIKMASDLNEDRLFRLIQTYKMTDDEIKTINVINKNAKRLRIQKTIDYYHNKNKDAYREEN